MSDMNLVHNKCLMRINLSAFHTLHKSQFRATEQRFTECYIVLGTADREKTQPLSLRGLPSGGGLSYVNR